MLETIEAEVSYDAWLCAKVARNLGDLRARLPHEEVERRMAERIASLKSDWILGVGLRHNAQRNPGPLGPSDRKRKSSAELSGVRKRNDRLYTNSLGLEQG